MEDQRNSGEALTSQERQESQVFDSYQRNKELHFLQMRNSLRNSFLTQNSRLMRESSDKRYFSEDQRPEIGKEGFPSNTENGQAQLRPLSEEGPVFQEASDQIERQTALDQENQANALKFTFNPHPPGEPLQPSSQKYLSGLTQRRRASSSSKQPPKPLFKAPAFF